MPFVEEIPSAQDIKDFDLPFWQDFEKPIEHRRTWLANRERDAFFIGIGVTGNQAFDDDIKQDAAFFLGRKRFHVILEPREISGDYKVDPYTIHYRALLKIMVYVSPERGMIDVLPEVRKAPNEAHPFLQNRPLNEFVTLLKEALAKWKAGSSNKYIHGTITVSFGF